MTARTHDLAAITALGALLIVYPANNVTLATALVAVLANQIGGIAPDIDQPTAPFWHNLPSGHFFGRLVGKGLGGHRFITHSIIGVLVMGLLAKLTLQFIHPLMPHIDITLVWWAFIVGMVSHLVMDTLTKEGVPWLLPIPVKFGFPPVRSMRITTGKSMEKLLFLLLLGLNIWYLASHYTHTVEVVRAVVARG